MTAKRIPGLDPLTGAASSSDDSLVIFDTSEDTTKRITRSQLSLALATDLTSTFLPLTGGTLTGATVVSVASASTALRVTQTGAGNAILIEDSANPDSSPVVVDSTGKLGIGKTTPVVSVDITATDAIRLPAGTTAQQPSGGISLPGMIRFNTTNSSFEGYNGSVWSAVGSGASGAGTDQIFWENQTTVTTDYSIGGSKTGSWNAMTAGPITINGGVTVTIPTGSTWTIV